MTEYYSVHLYSHTGLDPIKKQPDLLTSRSKIPQLTFHALPASAPSQSPASRLSSRRPAHLARRWPATLPHTGPARLAHRRPTCLPHTRLALLAHCRPSPWLASLPSRHRPACLRRLEQACLPRRRPALLPHCHFRAGAASMDAPDLRRHGPIPWVCPTSAAQAALARDSCLVPPTVVAHSLSSSHRSFAP
jgi:hypothetical protein